MDNNQRLAQKNNSRIFLYIAIGVLALGLVYAIFQKDINEYGDGLERIGERQDNYKKDNPNATKEEMDDAWNNGMDGLKKWSDDYKRDHPGATDADVEKAWNDAWGNNK